MITSNKIIKESELMLLPLFLLFPFQMITIISQNVTFANKDMQNIKWLLPNFMKSCTILIVITKFLFRRSTTMLLKDAKILIGDHSKTVLQL